MRLTAHGTAGREPIRRLVRPEIGKGNKADRIQDLMKTYAIRWKNLVNGRVGSGTLAFEKEEAERLAQELNLDYPEIHHEAVPWVARIEPEAELLAADPQPFPA
jgi:hypothetical protein